jgi:hypothetical protein
LIAGVLLAGCAGTGTTGSEDGASNASQGILLGLVVDDAIRPVAGAFVNVTGQGLSFNETTDDDGRFRFQDLVPGAYLVRVGKQFYAQHEQAVVVEAGNLDPDLVRFQLVFEPRSVPYAQLYKFDGYFECGVWPTNGCANVNIATGIVLCSLDLPCFNVTGDRSVELHPIDGIPTFLQSEMVWEPTTDAGRAFLFGIGHATREELQDGMADADNFTEGLSPLTLTINATTLTEASIGGDRMLLIQVQEGVTNGVPGGCVAYNPCGFGAAVQQSYTTYTHAFYGYLPPPGWRFTVDGPPPPPPA